MKRKDCEAFVCIEVEQYIRIWKCVTRISDFWKLRCSKIRGFFLTTRDEGLRWRTARVLMQQSGQDLASWKCFLYIYRAQGKKSWLCCTHRAHSVNAVPFFFLFSFWFSRLNSKQKCTLRQISAGGQYWSSAGWTQIFGKIWIQPAELSFLPKFGLSRLTSNFGNFFFKKTFYLVPLFEPESFVRATCC